MLNYQRVMTKSTGLPGNSLCNTWVGQKVKGLSFRLVWPMKLVATTPLTILTLQCDLGVLDYVAGGLVLLNSLVTSGRGIRKSILGSLSEASTLES